MLFCSSFLRLGVLKIKPIAVGNKYGVCVFVRFLFGPGVTLRLFASSY